MARLGGGSASALLRLALALAVVVAGYLYLGGMGTRGLDRLFPAGGAEGPDLFGISGDPGTTVTPLTDHDRRQMDRQREIASELARRHLGVALSRRSLGELETLQRLLDRADLEPDRSLELQALGLALGDLMQRYLGLEWVVYEDEIGRSRALRVPGSRDSFIFPMTMISRRVEGGAPVDVRALFEKTREAVRSQRPLPPISDAARA